MLRVLALLLLSPPLPAEDAALQLARTSLARELNIASESIRLRSSAEAQWPDSSLGCPKKGGKYTPAVVRGREVVLEAGGKEYAVHVSGGRAVVCTPRRTVGEDRIALTLKLTELARRDLAGRLKIAAESIEINLLRPRTWPDASLGCPQADQSYAQMETPGYVIELQAKGKNYTYHSDLRRVVSCGQ